MLNAIFRRPYRPIAQTIYSVGVAILGAVLLILGQPWAIGLLVVGGGNVLLVGTGAAWRHRHPN
jgi:hypothetical protein